MTPSKSGPKTNWLEEASRHILNGGLVALPFERLYGIAADAENQVALERIIRAKQRNLRSKKQPISVIGADLKTLLPFTGKLPALAERLAARYWPGPLTILTPASQGVPEALVGDNGLIGIRIPGPSPAWELAKATGKILTATSANLTGGPDVESHEDLLQLHMAGLDMVVEGRVPGPPGSTVVDASGNTPKVLRAGAIDLGPFIEESP